MIISEEVELVLGIKNHTFIKKKYNLSESLKPGDLVMVPVDILNKSSHFLVDVSCDYCGKEIKVPFKRYNLSTKVVNKYSCSSKECSNQKIKDVCQSKYGVDNPFQSEEIKDKIKESLLEKYGVEHPMYIDEVKQKIKKTSIERYGVDSYTKTDEYLEKTIKTNLERYGVEYHNKSIKGRLIRKETRIRNGNQTPDHLIEPFKLYRRKVDNYLDLIRNDFLSKWNGHDYYDGEYIKDNFKLDSNNRLYPSIDHKISVYYGFINNINWEEIANEYNLCVTKSHLNSSKGNMNYYEFIKKED
jgi:hypothetical protein